MRYLVWINVCMACCAVASAQTAAVTVPASRDTSAQWPGIANTSEFQGAKTVTDLKAVQDVALRGVAHLAKDAHAEAVLEKAAKPFAVVGDALSAYEVGEAYARGETGVAATKATRLAIDKAMQYGCSTTGPMAVPCEATYAAATMAGDVANEHWKINDKINKHVYEPLYDAYRSAVYPELDPEKPEFWEAAQKKHDDAMAARRQQAHERFASTTSSYQAEQARIDSELAARSVPSSGSSPASDDGAFDDFLGTLANQYLQQQQLQSVPARAESPASSAATPGGCHPGHDEGMHPGGCHEGAR